MFQDTGGNLTNNMDTEDVHGGEKEGELISVENMELEQSQGACALRASTFYQQEFEKKLQEQEEETEHIINRILQSQTHYEILGIKQDSSTEDIRKAYRALALKCHPDKSSSEQAHKAFIAITEACQVLSEPNERVKYDRDLERKETSSRRNEYSMDRAKQFFHEVLLGKMSTDEVNMEDIICQNRVRLKRKINVEAMCSQMYDRKLITEIAYKKIKDKSYPDNADELIFLLQRPTFAKARCFEIIECFVATGQENLLHKEDGEEEKDRLLNKCRPEWEVALNPNEVGPFLLQSDILTDTEYHLSMNQRAPQQKMRSILDHLQRKPVCKFNQFYEFIQKKLKHTLHIEQGDQKLPVNHIVENVSSSESTDDTSAEILFYIQRFCKQKQNIPLIKWIRSEATGRLDQLYTTPRLIYKEPHGGEFKKKLLKSDKEMFQMQPGEQIHPRTFNIIGKMGSGKTTFVQHLAKELGSGEEQSTAAEGNASHFSNHFKMVIPIQLRSVAANFSLEQIIFEKMIPREAKPKISEEAIKQTLTSLNDTLLFIFDGYDEYNERNTHINEIMMGQSYPYSSVIITSRPTKPPPPDYPCDRYIELDGFSVKQQETYVNNFFGFTQRSKDLLHEIRQKWLYELFSSPILLMFLCVLFKHKGNIGKSMVELYEKLVCFLYDRYCNEKGISYSEDKQKSDILQMGQIALKFLLLNKLEFQIDPQDPNINVMLETGIMHIVDPPDLSFASYGSFFHTSMQEFLAAKEIHNSQNYNTLIGFSNSLSEIEENMHILQLVCQLAVADQSNKNSAQPRADFLSPVINTLHIINTSTKLNDEVKCQQWKVKDIFERRLWQICNSLSKMYDTLGSPSCKWQGITGYIYKNYNFFTGFPCGKTYPSPICLDIYVVKPPVTLSVQDDHIRLCNYDCDIQLDFSRLTVIKLKAAFLGSIAWSMLLSKRLTILDLENVTVFSEVVEGVVTPCPTLKYVRLVFFTFRMNDSCESSQSACLLADALISSTQLQQLEVWYTDLEGTSHMWTAAPPPQHLKHFSLYETEPDELKNWASKGPGGLGGRVTTTRQGLRARPIWRHKKDWKTCEVYRSTEWVEIQDMPLPSTVWPQYEDEDEMTRH